MSAHGCPHADKAKSLAQQGRIREALNCYDLALRNDPDNDILLVSRATALITLGRYEEAVVDCRRAGSLNPKSSDAWTNMGVALEKMNRLPEAAEALERATAVNPYDCYARAMLGIVYQKLNQEDRAEAQNRLLQDLIFPNEYAGFFFGTAAFMLGVLLGGIRGVEGKPFGIILLSEGIILLLFLILCFIYWRSLRTLNQINRNVIVVPYPVTVEGDRSAKGMYIVLGIMIAVFIVGIVVGTDVWNWLR